MWKFLILFCCIVASVKTLKVNLVRTAGAHLGSHFLIGTNKTLQYRFLLFDLSSTALWTFLSTNGVENTDVLPGAFDISKDNATLSAFNNQRSTYDLSYKFFFNYGYYDQPFSYDYKPFNITMLQNGETVLRNKTTTILGIDTSDVPNYEYWNRNLFDGVFGIGKGLDYVIDNGNYTNGWIQKNSTYLMYTPRDQATMGQLLIDGDEVPEGCESIGVAVNLSKVVYLRYSDFEFNITSVAGKNDGSVYTYQKTWPATITTMSSFITVDNTTWNWIDKELNPVSDPYASVVSDIPHPYYKVKCSAADEFNLVITVTDQISRKPFPLLIPGSALIKPNPMGDCFLRVQKNSEDFWVLGTNFLENYCFQLSPSVPEIIFMNTTDSEAYPPEPDMNTGQSQLIASVLG